MVAAIPASMQAVALPKYSKPTEYDIATLPTPKITGPDHVLIKVHAASINPVDVKMASGMAKIGKKVTFPYKIGYDVAGTIVEVGTSVTSFHVGDKVYSRIPEQFRGSVAEYVLSDAPATALMPEGTNFTQAAAIPLAALTALQAMQLADSMLEGGLKGKTVFVPAGLGGTGSFAVQLAKNVFGAGRVVTTLSTKKIEMAKDLFGGDTVQMVDYTKDDVVAAVGKGTVDYFFDTMAGTLKYLPLVKKGGVIVSISTIMSGDQAPHLMPDLPVVLKYVLNMVDWLFKWWTGRVGVQYTYFIMHPDGKDLGDLAEWVKEGKVTPLVGRTAKFSDIEGVRKGCQEVMDGKGGIGKFVIEMV